NYLRAARTGDDVVAELESRVTEALDFSVEILHLNMNTVPAAGYRFATIGHGPASGASLSAEQKTHAVTGDRCKRRAEILFDFEAEVCCVEFDGDGNVVDHVADAYSGHTIASFCLGTQWFDFHFLQILGVHDHVDPLNFPIFNREHESDAGFPTANPGGSHGTVDEGQLGAQGPALENFGHHCRAPYLALEGRRA